jgi:tetratricopeptide (TPR) repeat protein
MLKKIVSLISSNDKSEENKEINDETQNVVKIELQNRNPQEENIKARQDKLKADFANSKNDMAVEAMKKGNITESIRLCKESIDLNPNSHISYYNLGNAYFQKEEYENAIQAYTNSIRFNSENHLSHYNIAVCFYRKGDFMSAAEHYEKAVKIYPTDHVAYYNLAKTYEQTGDIVKAIQSYEYALKIKEDYSNAHFNLAEIYRFLDYNNKAITEYSLYLKYNPEAEDKEEVEAIIRSLGNN